MLEQATYRELLRRMNKKCWDLVAPDIDDSDSDGEPWCDPTIDAEAPYDPVRDAHPKIIDANLNDARSIFMSTAGKSPASSVHCAPVAERGPDTGITSESPSDLPSDPPLPVRPTKGAIDSNANPRFNSLQPVPDTAPPLSSPVPSVLFSTFQVLSGPTNINQAQYPLSPIRRKKRYIHIQPQPTPIGSDTHCAQGK
jgi:hypothetical protein